jgi:hypothetical protein
MIAQHFANILHRLELPLSRGPTKFPLLSYTFIHRSVVMNTCLLSSKTVRTKFVLNTDFLLLEWSHQAVLCCSDLICQSQVMFLLLSGFSVFYTFRPALLYSGNTQYIQNAAEEVSNLKSYNQIKFNYYVNHINVINIILWK